jgi:hypothetical protein
MGTQADRGASSTAAKRILFLILELGFGISLMQAVMVLVTAHA